MRKIIFALTLALAARALAAQPGKPAVAPGEDWVALFNGKDLSGWTKSGRRSGSRRGGIIHGRAITQEYGYLETNKLYATFTWA